MGDTKKATDPTLLVFRWVFHTRVSPPLQALGAPRRNPKDTNHSEEGPFQQHNAFTHSGSAPLLGCGVDILPPWCMKTQRHLPLSSQTFSFSSSTCPTLLFFSPKSAFSMSHLENKILRTAFYSALKLWSICYTHRALDKQSWAFLSRLFLSGYWSASVKIDQACSVCFTCESPWYLFCYTVVQSCRGVRSLMLHHKGITHWNHYHTVGCGPCTPSASMSWPGRLWDPSADEPTCPITFIMISQGNHIQEYSHSFPKALDNFFAHDLFLIFLK